MKYKLVAFWLIVFGALFAFLQMCFEYHFYYIEQSQLFLFSEAYIRNKLLLPGGFSMLVAEFLVQFFIRPYVGALVTAVLLTGVGVCTAGIVKRIAPVSGLFILYVLPMLALLFRPLAPSVKSFLASLTMFWTSPILAALPLF